MPIEGDTNPYIDLREVGSSGSEPLDMGRFQQVVSSIFRKYESDSSQSLVFVQQSPMPGVTDLCKRELDAVPEAHLQNSEIMFSFLRNLFDRAVAVVRSSNHDSFYEEYARHRFYLNRDNLGFDDAVTRLQNEDLLVIVRLLGSVATRLGLKGDFDAHVAKHNLQPRGNTMIDGLKPKTAYTRQKTKRFVIENPDRKPRALRQDEVPPSSKKTETDGLFIGPVAKVDIPPHSHPVFPKFVPETAGELSEILPQVSSNPESVRFVDEIDEVTVEELQDNSSVDAEIASTPHVDIDDEDTWVQEPAVEPIPKPKVEPVIQEKPVVLQQPTSKRAGDLRAHVPPMRPPMSSESSYNPEEPTMIFGKQTLTRLPKHDLSDGFIDEPFVKLPEAGSADNTDRLTTPTRDPRRARKRNKLWLLALAGITALGAAAVGSRAKNDSAPLDVQQSSTPPVAPPAPNPTPRPIPVPKTAPTPEPEMARVFDAESVPAQNFLLKALVREGKFTLKSDRGGVNHQFLRLATNGANAEQKEKLTDLNTKIDQGVYAVAMEKFGNLSPQQIREIKNDSSHPDHGFLMSTLAISEKYNQLWSPTLRVMKKNPDGTAVYDAHGKPVFEVKNYWDEHKDAYEYGKKFVEEMKAKGYANVHNIGAPGMDVSIENVTYWSDVLEIMEVERKLASAGSNTGSGVLDPVSPDSGSKDGTPPSREEHKGTGKQGYWKPPAYNSDPQLHNHKNPIYIEPDRNSGEIVLPNKHAQIDAFVPLNPAVGDITPTNIGTGSEVVRASHRVDMSFLEKDSAQQFANLFRLNRKIHLKKGETFWSVMEKAIADSSESVFVKSGLRGLLTRWKAQAVDQLPFSVFSQAPDGLIVSLDHPEFVAEVQKSLTKARKMDVATAKKREEQKERLVGPLYLSAVYRPAEGVRPKDLLIGDIRRSNLSPFVEGAIMRQLDRIKGVPFTSEVGSRVYRLKPHVKSQLEFAANIAKNREDRKKPGNADVDMSFARPKPPEPLKYGNVVEMHGVPTAIEVPFLHHPVEFLEKILVERLQQRRKVLANNPNNMVLIGQLLDAEHQVKAKCSGMRRMGLKECVKVYSKGRKGFTNVVWKSSVVESFARIMNPLFEKSELSLHGIRSSESRRPLPTPRYKQKEQIPFNRVA